ncbi:MAG: SET domain-containing protein-lysine N-methyltransferase [Flavobacterium sp.]|uniref:SET domain-containing protein n=1 Tax=Flavobacterium sp. TaxID=239 RepID=UPI0012077846|nr:SET domain-containing protein [Flavobacterium sp.]RZJ68522.1 MAG: SET domain-containing protein-lysine N-methyltransferase [Flavobacterium sp.]
MIHPDTELRFISDAIGYGVVAKKLIPKGTITWVQDDLDRIFTAEDEQEISPKMRAYLDTYCFTNNHGHKVLCWDNAKYVNHSFNSSCMSTAYDFEIAVRDIHPGEQLTDDYGYLNIEEPFEAEDEGTDRKIVYPDDLLRYHETWDNLVRDNLDLIRNVEQPLQPFVNQNIWNEFESVIDGQAELKSLLTCYYDMSK